MSELFSDSYGHKLENTARKAVSIASKIFGITNPLPNTILRGMSFGKAIWDKVNLSKDVVGSLPAASAAGSFAHIGTNYGEQAGRFTITNVGIGVGSVGTATGALLSLPNSGAETGTWIEFALDSASAKVDWMAGPFQLRANFVITSTPYFFCVLSDAGVGIAGGGGAHNLATVAHVGVSISASGGLDGTIGDGAARSTVKLITSAALNTGDHISVMVDFRHGEKVVFYYAQNGVTYLSEEITDITNFPDAGDGNDAVLAIGAGSEGSTSKATVSSFSFTH